jgi:hypothetical protein
VAALPKRVTNTVLAPPARRLQVAVRAAGVVEDRTEALGGAQRVIEHRFARVESVELRLRQSRDGCAHARLDGLLREREGRARRDECGNAARA